PTPSRAQYPFTQDTAPGFPQSPPISKGEDRFADDQGSGRVSGRLGSPLAASRRAAGGALRDRPKGEAVEPVIVPSCGPRSSPCGQGVGLVRGEDAPIGEEVDVESRGLMREWPMAILERMS